MSDKIPTINIVSDHEREEDDHNHGLTLMEALTDVEELDEPNNRVKQKKPRLKIRLTDDVGGHTDIEDIEGSDNDEPPIVVPHKNIISKMSFNLDIGIVEEVCKITDKIGNTNSKLSSRKNLTPQTEKPIFSIRDEEVVTDMENWSVSDSDSFSDVPDIEIDFKVFESADSMKSKDSVKYSLVATPSPCATPAQYLSDTECNVKQNGATKKLYGTRLCASMFQLSNVTDVEILGSDADEEESTKKTKKTKKRRSKNKPQKAHTEMNRRACTAVDSQRSNYRYPTANIRDNSQKEGGATDIEEFETDSNVVVEYIYDSSAINKEIEKMQHFYGPTKEKHVYKRRKGKNYKSIACVSDEDSDKSNKDIKPKQTKHEKYILNRKPYLQALKLDENVSTEVESILSSDEDIAPAPVVVQRVTSGNLTEEELLLDGDNYLDNLPAIKLPNAKREIIFIKENDTNSPQVITTPLTEDIPLGLNITPEVLTDAENISGDDLTDNEEEIARSQSPTLDQFLDNETIEEFQSIKVTKSTQYLHIPENRTGNTTDTEDILLNTESANKPKLMTLTINKDRRSDLTDTEDVYFSDCGRSPRKSDLKKDGNKPAERTASNCKKRLHKNKVRIAHLHRDEALSDSDNLVRNYEESHSKNPLPKQRKQIETDYELESTEEVTYLRGGGYSRFVTDIDCHLNPEDYYFCRGKSKLFNNLYASHYHSNMNTGEVILAPIVSAKNDHKTNFNINYQPVKSRSLSMFYVNYCYTITIPCLETSHYYFGFSENASNVEKPRLPLVKSPNKKLPESIARLVTKFESFSANHTSKESNQTGDHHTKDNLQIVSNFKLKNEGNSFLKRNVVNAGNSYVQFLALFLL